MNILDLRKKIEPQVKVVERVILQKQPWYLEVLKIFLAIIIVSTIVWGISKADDLTLPKVEKPISTSFSVLGTVSSISTSTITFDIQGINKLDTNIFDTNTLTTIQTSKYTALTLLDINQGDKVIIQGTDFDGEAKATRLISFTSSIASSTIATSTATTTVDTTSTSTSDTSSSTTTPSVLDSLTNTVQNAVQSVVDVITGGASSSTPDDSSSTPPSN